MTRPPVELRPAYAWDCEDCGRENFHRGVVPTPEREAELREASGVPLYGGDFVLSVMPTQVICVYCGAVYGTVHWREQGEGHDR